MKYITGLCFSLIVLSCNSQTTTDKIDKAALPVIASFYKNIENKNIDQALVSLLQSNKYIKLQDSVIIKLQDQFRLINRMSGVYKGNRLLKKKIIGQEDIAAYIHLTKYEQKFYRFTFLFYNNGSETKLYKFYFDDSIEIEIEESLKFYN